MGEQPCFRKSSKFQGKTSLVEISLEGVCMSICLTSSKRFQLLC
jgi:hypothetical protein